MSVPARITLITLGVKAPHFTGTLQTTWGVSAVASPVRSTMA